MGGWGSRGAAGGWVNLRARSTVKAAKAAERLSLLTVAETRMNWGVKAVMTVAEVARNRWLGRRCRAIKKVQTTVTKPKSRLIQRPI